MPVLIASDPENGLDVYKYLLFNTNYFFVSTLNGKIKGYILDYILLKNKSFTNSPKSYRLHCGVCIQSPRNASYGIFLRFLASRPPSLLNHLNSTPISIICLLKIRFYFPFTSLKSFNSLPLTVTACVLVSLSSCLELNAYETSKFLGNGDASNRFEIQSCPSARPLAGRAWRV